MSNTQAKKAKRKAKLARRKKSEPKKMSVQNNYIRDGIKSDVFDCKINNIDMSGGMASIMLFKKASSDIIILGGFNLDLYCLGVKNAFLRAGDMNSYFGMSGDPMLESYPPEDAKKLIEGAVEYASKFGFEPHPDFDKAFKIFDNVDSSKSTKEFTFGMDGKPYFIAGPNDSPSKCKKIIAKLNKSQGGDGQFMMPNPDIEIFDDEDGEWETNKKLKDF